MFLFIIAALVLHPAVPMAVLTFLFAAPGKALLAWLLTAGGALLFGFASTPNVKHTWQSTIKNDSGAAVVAEAPVIIVGNSEENLSELIDPGATVEIDIAITVAKIQSGFIECTQNADVFTNAADGTGGQHIVLAAGIAVAWNVNEPMACPFTPNITKFYVKNNGSVAATFRGGFIVLTP